MWIAEALKVTVGHSWHASVKRAGQEPTGTLPDLHSRQTTSSSVGLSPRSPRTLHISHLTHTIPPTILLCEISQLHSQLVAFSFIRFTVHERKYYDEEVWDQFEQIWFERS